MSEVSTVSRNDKRKLQRLIDKASYVSVLGEWLKHNLPRGEYTGESIRNFVGAAKFPQAPSSAVWGNLTRYLENNGVIRRTKRITVTKDPVSHGRKTPVYVR